MSRTQGYESLFIPADGYHGNVLGTGCRVERAERGREVPCRPVSLPVQLGSRILEEK